ncbi:MAG: M28 family peptidase [Ignavibacteria bacterium]|nr:M28 family peptidase [Ignavibacteria bacterium]
MILSLLLALAIGGASEPRPFPPDAELYFDTVAARRHLAFLSSDEMRGRDTPSRELEQAADYIVSEFKRIGLEPINGSYDQVYDLERLDLRLPTSMYFTRGTDTFAFSVKTDFMPFEQTGEGVITNARVVFAGYGVTAPEYSYDDYAGIDVKGAVVVVLRGEPDNADTTRFRGKQFTRHGSNSEKLKLARSKGAVGLLVIDALRTLRKPFVSGYPWPSVFPNLSRASRPLQLPDSTKRIPSIHIGERPAILLFDSLAGVVSITRAIDSTLVPRSREIAGVRFTCSVALDHEIVKVRNVVGLLRGSETPDEYAVIGAHYDHVGVGKANAEGDSIYNGADDNGSGTTGLLLSAQALAASSQRPTRSIVYVAFSGEEKGLLGSKAYVRASPLPLSKCVAMSNMDMIGRCETNKLSIGGNERCPDLMKINEETNASLAKPFNLAYDIEQYFFRSDQASFAMKRIPVIFYFTGEHKDYHKPGDEISKINMADLVGITRLATHVMWTATQMPRGTYVPAGFEE